MKLKLNLLFIALALQLWPTAAFCQDDGNRNQTPAHVNGHNTIDEGGDDDDPWQYGYETFEAFVSFNGNDYVSMTFEIHDEETVFVGANGGCCIAPDTQGAIEIPSTIHGYMVIGISSYAFSGCTGLTSVVIPNGITSIGDYAFSACSSLASIEIPNSVTKIGFGAFEFCISLPIEDNCRYADTYLIEAMDKTINRCTIKKETRFIGSYAFSDCKNLTSIVIPNSVVYIGDYAFQNCI